MTAKEFSKFMESYGFTDETLASVLHRSARYISDKRTGRSVISQELAGWCRDFSSRQKINKKRLQQAIKEIK